MCDSVLMAESEEQGGGGGGGGGATTDPRLDAINDYTLKTLKVRHFENIIMLTLVLISVT